MIGLVNGQEKLTITESILLRYTTVAVHSGAVQTAAWQRRCARQPRTGAVEAVSFQVDGLWILAGP